MSQLEPMVKQLEQMTTLDALPAFFQQIQQQFGYRFCGIVLWRSQRTPLVLSASADSDFHRLVGNETLQQFCHKRCTPAQALTEQFVEHSAQANSILVIPVKALGTDHGALLIGLYPEQATLAQQIAWYWTIIAHYIVETLTRVSHDDSEAAVILTQREKACLSWAAKGKTSWEISQILAISERTVNFHLGNCISKTNSNNRQQAISRCLAVGQINL